MVDRSGTRCSVGIRHLDDLLGGGLRPGSAFLVIGPAFSGKRYLQQKALAGVVHAGWPAVVVTTRKSAPEVNGEDIIRRQEHRIGASRIQYVDAYSRQLGFQSALPHVRLVEPARLGTMVHVINGCLSEVESDPRQNRLLLVDSLTGLVAHNGMGKVYAFAEMLIGCAKAHNATIHIAVDAKAHTTQELALLRFLADNVLEMRSDENNRVLHISGVDIDEDLPWIEYRYDKDEFEIVGSTTATRIR